MQLPHEEVFPDLHDNYKAIPIFVQSYRVYRELILKRHIITNVNDRICNIKSTTYKIGKILHRDGGLPAIEYANGNKEAWVTVLEGTKV